MEKAQASAWAFLLGGVKCGRPGNHRMVTLSKRLDWLECVGQVAQSLDSFYNKQRNRTLQNCSRQKVDVNRPLARIKEAHEVEQDWPDFNGLGSVRSDGP